METSYAIHPRESSLSVETSKTEVKDSWLSSSLPTWSSRYKCFLAYLCFIMSYISSIKFCKRLGTHKVAIFVPYLVCNIFIGIPAVLVEIMLGRFVMGNLSKVWGMCIPITGVFWCLVLMTFYAVIVNHIYNIYLLKYLFASFHGEWDRCDQPWTKMNCYEMGRKSEAFMICLKNHSEEFCRNLNWETSGMQFWKYRIQSTSDVLQIFLSFLFLAITVIIISVIIYKGILSLEKMLTLLVYPSVALWALLVIVSFSATNSVSGFKTLLDFNWDDLIKPEVWLEGFEDMFYLVGLGRLCLSFISSHGKFTDNILIDVAIVIFASISSSLLITTPILTIIVNVEYWNQGEKKLIFKNVTDVFVTISEAVLFYPYPAFLWSALYYLDCYIVSFSSQAVLVLALCKALEGVINKKKSYFYIVLAVSVSSFVAAGCFQFIAVIREIDHAAVVIGIVALCTISWQLFYGIGRFNSDYYFMMGYPVPLFLKFTWITVLILPIMEMVFKMCLEEPVQPMKTVIFIYFGIPVFIYILVILINILIFRVRKEKISRVFMANPNWGPENVILKKSRVFFEKSLVTREFMYRQELYKKPFIKPPDFSEQNIVNLV